MTVNPTKVIARYQAGALATINQQIDYETAAIAAIGLGYEVSEAKFEVEEDLGELLTAEQEAADTSKQSLRPPVVTIMATDHGKTRLLDTIILADAVPPKRVGSPSISARTRWNCKVRRSPSWIHRATKRLQQ